MKSARPQILLSEDLNREDLQENPTDDGKDATRAVSVTGYL